MRRFIVRSAGAVALVGALAFGTVSAFAAEGQGSAADSADTLPAGAISAAIAQQDALANYPGATVVAEGVNDQNGTITYGFQVTQKGVTYDVQVDVLNGKVLQADAGGSDTGTAGEVAGAGENGMAAADDPGGADVQQGGNN